MSDWKVPTTSEMFMATPRGFEPPVASENFSQRDENDRDARELGIQTRVPVPSDLHPLHELKTPIYLQRNGRGLLLWGTGRKERKGGLEARFWAKVNKDGPLPPQRRDLGQCWLWTGSLCPGGYGGVKIDGRRLLTHRVAYLISGFTIPKGYVLDHLCCVRRCVRPSHMEPVTHGENIRRGFEAKRRALA